MFLINTNKRMKKWAEENGARDEKGGRGSGGWVKVVVVVVVVVVLSVALTERQERKWKFCR